MDTLAESKDATNMEVADQTKEQAVSVGDVLHNGNFRLLWLGQIISDFGSSLTNLALLVLVNQITGSVAALALMGVMLALPQIVFGLLAGVFVDRHNRKQIMLASDLLRGFLVLGFIFVGAKDSLWLLYVIAFVQATIGTFFTPARMALIPNLVPERGLLAANSLAQTSSIVAGLLGTTVAGIIIGSFNSIWLTFTMDAATFFISFVLISGIKVQAQQTEGRAKAEGGGFFGEFMAGLRVIGQSRLLLGMMVGAGVTMLGFGAINILIVPFILNELHVPATWFGATEFGQTAGMVLGGALVALVASRFKATSIVSGGLVALGLLVCVTAAVGEVWQLIVVLFAIGLVLTPFQASVSTITQTAVGDELRGRVGATLNTVITTASLVSMAASGVLASAIGIRNVFLLAGVLSVVAALFAALIFHRGKAVAAAELPKLEERGTLTA